MTVNELTFAEWQQFQASNIVHKALMVGLENQADYLFVQIRSAIEAAYRHGAEGKGRDEFMKWSSPKP